MTILYHGSIDIVPSPEIRIPNRTLDYGAGFYLTTSEEQAEAWVRRKLTGALSSGYVNVYTFNKDIEPSLKILNFNQPDEDWLDFVMANRMNFDFSHDYDIVIGPVANDRVYASFALYESSLLDKHELIKELRAYKLVNQIFIHSEKALACLEWKEAKEVRK